MSIYSSKYKFIDSARRKKTVVPSAYCLLNFPSEKTHGVWPENLVRQKQGDKFTFQAKYGQKWFDCVVLKSGTKSECEVAQSELERENTLASQSMWSSVDTEASSDDMIDDSESESEQVAESLESKKSRINVKRKRQSNVFLEKEKESESDALQFLKDLNETLTQTSKKTRSDREQHSQSAESMKMTDSLTSAVEPERTSATNQFATSSDIQELKTMIGKIYSMTKRQCKEAKVKKAPPTPNQKMIENGINLIGLPGKTPTRYMLNVARVILSSEQLMRGFVPDFRGSKENRIPITEESISKMKTAVQIRFGYAESDMENLWSQVLRPSLVQTILDSRKSEKKRPNVNSFGGNGGQSGTQHESSSQTSSFE